MKKKPETKTYITTKNPLIEAITGGLYSFLKKEDGVAVLNQIRDKHIISSVLKVQEDLSHEHLIMWVRGYEISPEEKKNGYKGNYALIHVDTAIGKKFTLRAQKVESELKFHPEKKYEKQTHPNWGFPVLRRIKKKTEYKTIEEAARELQNLQEQFPLVCIPAQNKLYTMIFEKVDDRRKVNKYVLEIKPLETGGYIIVFYLNETKKKKKNNAKTAVKGGKRGVDGRVDLASGEKIGTHTTKVVVRREMKKKKIR